MKYVCKQCLLLHFYANHTMRHNKHSLAAFSSTKHSNLSSNNNNIIKNTNFEYANVENIKCTKFQHQWQKCRKSQTKSTLRLKTLTSYLQMYKNLCVDYGKQEIKTGNTNIKSGRLKCRKYIA